MVTAFHASRLCAGLDGEDLVCVNAEKGSLSEDTGIAYLTTYAL